MKKGQSQLLAKESKRYTLKNKKKVLPRQKSESYMASPRLKEVNIKSSMVPSSAAHLMIEFPLSKLTRKLNLIRKKESGGKSNTVSQKHCSLND